MYPSRRRLAGRVYYGWVVAVACLLASVIVFGTTYSFGVFFERMLADLGGSRARLSLVFGVQTAVIYVAAIGAGGLVDRLGPRRAFPVGGALVVGGLVATARTEGFVGLVLAYGVVTAVGLAVAFVVAYATVPRWFGRRRGTATGMATAGLGVGLVVVPPVAEALIAAAGWRNAYLTLAGFLAALAVVVTALLADHPRDVGADASHEFPDGVPERTAGVDRARVRRVVGSRAFGLAFLGVVLVYCSLFVILNHVVAHASATGLSRDVGVAAVSAIGVTTGAARLGLGAVSDRVGRVRLFVACSVGMGVTTAGLTLVETPAAFVAVAALFGIGYGGNGAMLSPLVADLFGESELSTLFGVLTVGFSVAGLFAPPLAGLGFDRFGSYDPALVAVGALALAGAGCVWLAGRTARGGEAGQGRRFTARP